MPKIIDIDNQAVTIETDEGEIKQVTSTGLDFVPQIGDEVQVVDGGSRVFVLKTEPMYDGGDFTITPPNPRFKEKLSASLHIVCWHISLAASARINSMPVK